MHVADYGKADHTHAHTHTCTHTHTPTHTHMHEECYISIQKSHILINFVDKILLKTLIILLEKDSTIDIIDLFVTYDISASGQCFKICVAFLLTYINPIVQIPSAYLDC